MTFWLDAHLSPSTAVWLSARFPEHQTFAIYELGLRDAEDSNIFLKAKESNAVIITKDNDFINLVEYFGTPPQVIWLRCGNTSNTALRILLENKFEQIVALLESGVPIIEIRDK